MQKIILFMLLLILPLLPIISTAETKTESASSKKISALFQSHYNAGEYRQIFELFATQMQEALPLEQSTVFFQGLASQAELKIIT